MTIDQASGRPMLTITKDSKLTLSWGVLIALILTSATGAYWFSLELGKLERRMDSVVSDLNYTSKTVLGYTNRTDRLDSALQEIGLMRHKLEAFAHSGDGQDRRLSMHDAKLEDIQRRVAEHHIVIDYIMRWINPDTPKKRQPSNWYVPSGPLITEHAQR